MPRKPRIYLPDVPSHIVQRGNDRNPCFFEEENYLFYLECLTDACRRYSVAVHAYVLMTNHVHLLMTPESVKGISLVMQLVGNRYVQYINKTYRRSGTLWEGRHKASLIDAERYLLACYRYIELNPVRANMTTQPGDYRWSSYRHHAFGEPNTLICDHEAFLRIANTNREREKAYRALFRASLDERDIHDIRRATTFSAPLGNSRFRDAIATMVGRSVGQSFRGRPPK